jgi:hypothetical protein
MVLLPFKIAALPDLIASEAIFAMTSGRASKMIRRTPMGQVTRSRSSPSSSLVRKVTFPTAILESQRYIHSERGAYRTRVF